MTVVDDYFDAFARRDEAADSLSVARRVGVLPAGGPGHADALTGDVRAQLERAGRA
jgi:hypothetical protein